MRRGTTVILRLVTSHDWTGYELHVTLEDKSKEMCFTDERLKISESGTDVYLELSQEETLAFTGKSLQVQIRGKKDGVVRSTDIAKIKVLPTLCEEVL